MWPTENSDKTDDYLLTFKDRWEHALMFSFNFLPTSKHVPERLLLSGMDRKWMLLSSFLIAESWSEFISSDLGWRIEIWLTLSFDKSSSDPLRDGVSWRKLIIYIYVLYTHSVSLILKNSLIAEMLFPSLFMPYIYCTVLMEFLPNIYLILLLLTLFY